MIEVAIVGIPARPNESRRRNWHANAEEAAGWRTIAAEATRRALIGKVGPFPYRYAELEYVFVLERAMGDLDGLVAASKPLVDGLRDGGLLRDDSVNALPSISARWVRGTMKGVLLRVRKVEEA